MEKFCERLDSLLDTELKRSRNFNFINMKRIIVK